MQMIVASRLADGRVVFLAEESRWVESIQDGLIAESEAATADLLDLAHRAVHACEVVDPYAIDVTVEAGVRRPASLREAIRAFGPSTAGASDTKRS